MWLSFKLLFCFVSDKCNQNFLKWEFYINRVLKKPTIYPLDQVYLLELILHVHNFIQAYI